MEIIGQVEEMIDCKECAWNKLCITPPMMTKQEIKSEIEPLGIKKDDSQGPGKMIAGLMKAMFYVGKDRQCEVCPIFAGRLKRSRKLAEDIKKLMQKWKEEVR